MAQLRRLTVRNFLDTDLLSGELRVVGRSRRRRGTRPPEGSAKETTRVKSAVTGGGSGENVGGDATSSPATATKREKHAGTAGKKPKAERAPKKKSKKKWKASDDLPSLWDQRMELRRGPRLPQNGYQFLQAVNRQIDMVSLYVLLLRGTDERSVARLAEQALKLAYQKASGEQQETFTVVDIPGTTGE